MSLRDGLEPLSQRLRPLTAPLIGEPLRVPIVRTVLSPLKGEMGDSPEGLIQSSTVPAEFRRSSSTGHCEPVTDVTGVAIRSPLHSSIKIPTHLRSSDAPRPLCVKGAGLNRGPRRSPTKWVRWGKEEQGSERSFSPQRRKRSSRTFRRRGWGIVPQRLDCISGCRLGAVRFLDID